MAPEQARGEADARSDLFSAGVILAEMVSPDGVRDFESRQSVWSGIRAEPVQVPDSPWSPVVKRAVAKNPAERFQTAHELTRALEEVAFRVHDETGLEPYPGLASFDEGDAEYFFGREAEVETVWQKLQSAQLLGIIGASGSGKSSFIGAGLVPAKPEGWAIVRCTPGNSAVASLRRTIVSEIKEDAAAVQQLAAGGDEAIVDAFASWRRKRTATLLIVDQFEEMFTQNSEEEQTRCAELLGGIALDADVRVLLSMRDDFFVRCNRFECLRPMYSEVTVLDPPRGSALRRAVVQPALRCGYRFEDDELADEILAEVEGERGALPLLAFALARLWDTRDRENGLITRQAYRDIGGVGGALAQHAERLMEELGPEQHPTVREIFRNLVTAQGTRAARDVDELLSVFGDNREGASDVLRALVDARLLTSYEVPSEDGPGRQRVEVIHESLLSAWPRLVGWRTQDADAARLRDELRAAAKLWNEHRRTEDRLWTGAAYREYSVWRERYPGGLTDLEEVFAAAMTSLAGRRRRRRRIAVAVIITTLLVGLTVVASFWRRSVVEARRAEAAKLLALAQLQIETGPTEALAYATSSLELADTEEARIFALRSLWAGPPLRVLSFQDQFTSPLFSPDGRWLAVEALVSEGFLVYGENGGEPIALGGQNWGQTNTCSWSRGGLLVTPDVGRARVWEIPSGRLIREIELGGEADWRVAHDRLMAVYKRSDPRTGHKMLRIRSWGLRDGGPNDLGELDWTALGADRWAFDPGGDAWIYSKGDSVYSRPLPVTAAGPDKVIARHSADHVVLWSWRRGVGLFSNDAGGEIILWTAEDGTSVPGRRLRRPETATTRLYPDPSGRWAVESPLKETRVRLWDLAGLAWARPLELLRSARWYGSTFDFHPHGDWVVATTDAGSEVSFWPLNEPFQTVVEGYETLYRRPVAFTPDGRYLVTYWGQDRVRLWPLPGSERARFVDLMLPRVDQVRMGLALDPRGEHVLSVGSGDCIVVLSIDGAEPRRLGGFPASDLVEEGAFSPSGRLVAAASNVSDTRATLRVWNLETGEVRAFDQPKGPESGDKYFAIDLSFADETTLYTAGANGLLRWDLETGSCEEALKAPPGGMVRMSMIPDRRKMLTYEERMPRARIRGSVKLHDLSTGQVRSLPVPGKGWLELSPDGTVWLSGEPDRSIQIGRTEGGHVHLLGSRVGPAERIAISPDNRWIASSGADKTLRLWPMPDLDKPPLHTLPHDELIAKLHSLTNLRAVRDEDSRTGWKFEVGPFPGWETVPSW
jgi:WD40 repeat protein